jgi:hypothetical protein
MVEREKSMNWLGKTFFYSVLLYGAVGVFWALQDLYRYWRLDAQVIGKVEEAQVQELSHSCYDIVATYTYTWKGEVLRATTSLGKPYQLNQFSAEKAKEELKKASPTIYIDHNHPTYTSFHREFPTKSLLNVSVTLGVALYLWILQLYAQTRRPDPA